MNREQALFANEAFYLAFNQRDLQAMDQLWARQASVSCIHPGWAALVGRREVLASWKRILSNPAAPELTCLMPRALPVAGGVVQVMCYERLGGDVLTASNWFVLEDGLARLVHHQASPCAHPPPLEEAAPRPLQ